MVQAWYLDESTEEPKFVDLDTLHKISGVEYFKVDEKNVDNDELILEIRNERGYTHEDYLTCSKECLPNYEEQMKMFFREHLHAGEEIRLVMEGVGYFDIRDTNDKWIRVEVVPGDLLILPGGIYHRFSLGVENYVKLKRYFIDNPNWAAYNRPADEMDCRKAYLQNLKNYKFNVKV